MPRVVHTPEAGTLASHIVHFFIVCSKDAEVDLLALMEHGLPVDVKLFVGVQYF